MERSKDSIIFCQAPADIPYLLTIYEEKARGTISVYVINVENMFRFIENLNLELRELVFIPYSHSSLRSISHLYKEKKRIKELSRSYFSFIKDHDIYFFSRFEDWLTSAFIHVLTKAGSNTIYYVDYYDFSAEVYERQPLNLKTLMLK